MAPTPPVFAGKPAPTGASLAQAFLVPMEARSTSNVASADMSVLKRYANHMGAGWSGRRTAAKQVTRSRAPALPEFPFLLRAGNKKGCPSAAFSMISPDDQSQLSAPPV